MSCWLRSHPCLGDSWTSAISWLRLHVPSPGISLAAQGVLSRSNRSSATFCYTHDLPPGMEGALSPSTSHPSSALLWSPPCDFMVRHCAQDLPREKAQHHPLHPGWVSLMVDTNPAAPKCRASTGQQVPSAHPSSPSWEATRLQVGRVRSTFPAQSYHIHDGKAPISPSLSSQPRVPTSKGQKPGAKVGWEEGLGSWLAGWVTDSDAATWPWGKAQGCEGHCPPPHRGPVSVQVSGDGGKVGSPASSRQRDHPVPNLLVLWCPTIAPYTALPKEVFSRVR